MQGQTKCWHHFCPANLTMVQNKLEHCLLGMGVCAFGIVGHSQGWHSRSARRRPMLKVE